MPLEESSITVEAAPEDALSRIESYLVLDWPYRSSHERTDGHTIEVYRREPSSAVYGTLGCGALLLTIVTFGLFLVVVAVIELVRYFNRPYMCVTADPVGGPLAEGPPRTQIKIASNREDWHQHLSAWVVREFVHDARQQG